MKRLLLALMLIAAPAWGRTLIVESTANGGSTPAAVYLTNAAIRGVLDRIGGSYDMVPASAVSTSGLKQGKVFWERNWKTGSDTTSRSTSYDCVIMIWQQNLYGSGTFNPNMLTLAANWPSVPTIFISMAASNANAWDNGATDTTGIGTSLPSNSFRDRYRVELQGSTEAWMSQGTQFGVKGSAGPGIFRPILSSGHANGTSGGTTPAGGASESCAYCDMFDGDSATARTDTLVMWARYRSAVEPAPLIFAQTSATTGMINPEIIAMALAMADSASGGKVFDLVPSRGPAKIGLYVNGGVATGAYNVNNGGVFCRSDSCDSANVRATVRDLGAINVAFNGPLKFTVGCDPDSMRSLGWLVNYWQLAPGMHFAMEPRSGAITGGAVRSGTTGYHAPFDPLGYFRTRVIWKAGQGSVPYACSEADSDQLCLMKGGYALMDSMAPGRTDHGIVGYDEDWSNLAVGRTDPSKIDTLGMILAAAGVRTLVTSPDRVVSNAFITDAVTGTNVHGWYPSQRAWKLPNGQTLYILRTRGYTNISPAGALTFVVTHNMADEFMQGFFMGYWFPQGVASGVNNIFYKGEGSPHMFHVPLEVMSMPAVTLGGAGQGTTAHRRGYYEIKWLANQVSAINRLAGRQLIRFEWLEDMRP